MRGFLIAVALSVVACVGSGDDDAVVPATLELTTTIDDGPANIAFVAFRDDDGDGRWRALSGTSGVYPFTRSGSRYSLVWACAPDERPEVVTLHATAEEVAAPIARCFGDALGGPWVQLSGTVAGATADVRVQAGSSRLYSSTDTQGPYALQLPPSTPDLVAWIEPAPDVYRAVLRRRIDLQADRVEDLDLAADGFVLDESTIRIENATESLRIIAQIELADSGMPLPFAVDPARGLWPGLPSGRLQDGDLHLLAVFGDERTAYRYVNAPQPLTVRMPDNVILDGTSASPVAATPYSRVVVRFADDPEARLFAAAWYAPAAAPPEEPMPRWIMRATPAWLGDGVAAVEVPALDGVDGWSSTWVSSSTDGFWSVSSTHGNATPAQLLGGGAFDGLALDFTYASGFLRF